MKFNWGTGIFIFLVVFLLGAAAFIVFAFNQGVNLVHKDYYEKGVDYTDQMNVGTRSVEYEDAVKVQIAEEYILINFDPSLAAEIDSGSVLLFRPSNSNLDMRFALNIKDSTFHISKMNLISGRYILKVYWFSEGLKYEVDQTLIMH